MRPGSKVVRWTDADISFLTTKNNHLSHAEVAAAIGRTPEAVQSKAMELRLHKPANFVIERSKDTQFKAGNKPVLYSTAKRRRKDGWTEEENNILLDNWALKTASDIAGILKTRSASAIKTKATELGLKKTDEAKRIISTRYNTGQFTKDRRPVSNTPDGAITIRTDKKGRKSKWIKITVNKWEPLSRHVWLTAGNIIPDNHLISCKDHNPLNCDLSNLVCCIRGHQCQLQRIEANKLLREQSNIEKQLRRAARLTDKASKKLLLASQKESLRAEKQCRRALRITDKSAKKLLLATEKATQKADKLAAKNHSKYVKKIYDLTPEKINLTQLRAKARVTAAEEKKAVRRQQRALLSADLQKQKAAETKKLIKAEIARKAKVAKEKHRLENEAKEKAVLPTKLFDPSKLIKLQINERTTIYVKPGYDLQKLHEKYNGKLKVANDEKPWPEIPVPVYQF